MQDMNRRNNRKSDVVRMKKHIPIALVIDKSNSTEDIRESMDLYAKKLLQQMKDDKVFKGVVELLIVFYDNDIYHKNNEEPSFRTLDEITAQDIAFPASSYATDTGKALLYALDKLEEKKVLLRGSGELYFQPMLFLLTDGYPDPGEHAPERVIREYMARYRRAAKEIHDQEKKGKLTFIAAGIQIEDSPYRADMRKLRELSAYPQRALKVTARKSGRNEHEIVKITSGDGEQGERTIEVENFFDLILDMTHNTLNDYFTPTDEVVENFLNVLRN